MDTHPEPTDPTGEPRADLAQARRLHNNVRQTEKKVKEQDGNHVRLGRLILQVEHTRSYTVLRFATLIAYCKQFDTFKHVRSVDSLISKYRRIGKLDPRKVRFTKLGLRGLYAVSGLPPELWDIALRHSKEPRPCSQVAAICQEACRLAKKKSLSAAKDYLTQQLAEDTEDTPSPKDKPDAPPLFQRLQRKLCTLRKDLRAGLQHLQDGEIPDDALRARLAEEAEHLWDDCAAFTDALGTPLDAARDDERAIPRTLDDELDEDEDEERAGPNEDEDDEGPPSAARPFVDPLSESALAVPALRGDDFDLTPAERHLCHLIVLADRCRALVDAVVELRVFKNSDGTPMRLRRDIHNLLDQAVSYCDDLTELLTPGAQQAEPEPEPPLCLDQARAAACALDWLVFVRTDPYGQADPPPTEPHLWELRGLLPLFNSTVERFAAARAGEGPEHLVEHALMAQALPLLQDLANHGGQILSDFFPGVQAAAAEEHSAAAQQSARPGVITMGSDAVPRCYGVFARTAEGHTVVVPNDEATAELYIGGRGKGKTHQCRVNAENLVLTPPGLCRAPSGPQRAAIFETDVRRGQGRFELFQCFFPNHKPGDRRRLLDEYGVNPPPLALRYGTALVHPHELAQIRRDAAAFVERGLDLQPLLLGPEDLGGYAMDVLLASAAGGARAAQEQPMYLGFGKAMAARWGDQLTPQRMRTEVQGSDLGDRSKGILMRALDQIMPMWTEKGTILYHLRNPGMLFVLLRSRYLSPDFALTLQAVLLNALSRTPLGCEDWLRWFFIDELAKMLRNRVFAAYLLELLQELRHNGVSFSGCVQHLLNVPMGMLGQFSSIYLYQVHDPAVLRRLKAETGGFGGVTQAEVAAQGDGECLGWTQRSNAAQAKDVLRLKTRPTCMRAGGETMIIR